ncbi:MAG: type VI secretion system ATPase TssH [bacterium]|nr:type VI secretion system ATPase TssH [bacterium]
MITKEIKSLLSRLNAHTSVALEAAAGFSVTRTHYEVFPEHLLMKLLEEGGGDIPLIFSHFNVDQEKVWEALNRTLDRFTQGNTGSPKFSRELLDLIEQGWVVSSIHLDQSRIRSGALIEPYLEDAGFAASYFGEAIEKIESKQLRKEFKGMTERSSENVVDVVGRADRLSEMQSRKEGETALDLYTIDVTGKAKSGEIDPVFGRDQEIMQTIDILSRRRKNNPILVGEAGVGKTAIVEGLALRIANDDVTESLKGTQIRSLDLGLLQAGAGVKGEFENRLKSVISQVIESPDKIILFIDEAHTLIGAGGSAGVGDAANLLKPALARGQLKTIGATTFSEYKKYIEKDPALERRFQMVKIDEPDEETACVMLRGISKIYAKHHDLTITDDAIRAAVGLSKRYIAGRQLPDKAVDLLDTSAARVKMLAVGRPGRIELLERKREYVERRIAGFEQDIKDGYEMDEREMDAARKELEDIDSRLADYDKRWKEQREVADKIIKAREELKEAEEAGEGEDLPSGNGDLTSLRSNLNELQGEEPLVMTDVDSAVVASVVADWTGIPVGRMVKDQASALLDYEKIVAENIIGQDEGLAGIASSIRVSKSGLGNPEAPIGVFLLVGPSGVGKTETARYTAQVLFGGEKMMTVINMSEYQEKHSVSQLKGSPPGYVGYGEGGILTEAVRRRPYSVVILDEVEKADREVMNLFYQVFDKGFMRDGEGREIDFKNTVIMMTSNLATETIMMSCSDGKRPTTDELTELIRPELINHFQPALLARIKVIPFFPLDQEAIKKIVVIQLKGLEKRLDKSHRISMEYDDSILAAIASRCTDPSSGARNVSYIIDKVLLPDVSRALVAKLAEDQTPGKLKLTAAEGEISFLFE